MPTFAVEIQNQDDATNAQGSRRANRWNHSPLALTARTGGRIAERYEGREHDDFRTRQDQWHLRRRE